MHEQSYLEHLEANGFSVVRIDGIGVDTNALSPRRSMQCAAARPSSPKALYKLGRWGGRLDILRRVEKPSDLGAWSYEVIDTKLARETKGNTVLQICLYSDLLTDAQKLAPEFAYVVTPGSDFKPQAFRYQIMPRTTAGSGIAWSGP